MTKSDHIDPISGLVNLPYHELPLEVQEHLKWCDECRLVFDTSKNPIEVYRDNQIYELPESLRAKLRAAIIARVSKRSDERERSSVTFAIGEGLNPEQLKIALQALADYFRACGGIGFRIENPSSEAMR